MKTNVKAETDDDGDTDMFSLKRTDVDEDAKIVADYKGIKAPDMSVVQDATAEQGKEWPLTDLLKS